jgi:hypothetical protein
MCIRTDKAERQKQPLDELERNMFFQNQLQNKETPVSANLKKAEGGHKSASSTERWSVRAVIKRFARIQRRATDRRIRHKQSAD